MKYVTSIIYVILGGLVVYLLMNRCQPKVTPPPVDITDHRLDSMAIVIDTVLARAYERDSAAMVRDSVSRALIAYYKNKSENVRPRAEILIIDGSASDSLVAYQDSTLFAQGKYITELEYNNDKWKFDFLELDSAWKVKESVYVENLTGSEKEVETLTKDLDDEKSKRITIGPYVGYGVGPKGAQPTIGIALQYNIIKFKTKRKTR
jgi:hypothetical protein